MSVAVDDRPAAAATPRPVPAAALVLALTVVVTGLLIAFAWPSTRATLHDVPLGLSGPAAGQVEASLPPGAFEVHRYPDEAAARAAIGRREVYGAIVTGTGRPTVLTASAGGATVAQALGQLAAGSGAEVRDVVPAPADDPRGVGLAAGALPLVLAGIAAAALLSRLVAGRWARIGTALAFAVVGGASVAAALRFWIGALDGPYVALAAAAALGLGAVALALLGLESLLGPAGLGLGAAIMMVLGNPLSGAAVAPQMLPGGWGELGQALPPGAGISLLRSVAFFDGRGAGHALLVLSAWLVAGLALCTVAALRTPGRAPAPA
jgi:hypothetical protein